MEALKIRIETWLENAERNRQLSTTQTAIDYHTGQADAYRDVLKLMTED